MNASIKPAETPPKFFGALVAGFNLVANRAYLLILPIGLDLLLWFGPHFRLKALVEPIIKDLYTMPGYGLGDSGLQSAILNAYTFFLEHFNLLSLLRALPVGIPSLMAGLLPVGTPLGSPLSYEVNSAGQLFSGWLLFNLLGLALGSFYFGEVARATAGQSDRFSFPRAIWQVGQTLLLTFLLIVLLFLLFIPISIFSLLPLIAPGLAQFTLIFSSFVILWVFLPLVFSPHAIFVTGQNAFQALFTSLRLVRSLFPGVGLFLLSVLVLTQGMGIIWAMAPETSWLMLGGVFGNAFISTALLAASFIYFRGAASWAAKFRK